jgi:23S rRNA A2030 N6-methylase RlmJ
VFDQGKCPVWYPVKPRRKTSRVSNRETVIKLDEVMAAVFKKVSCK